MKSQHSKLFIFITGICMGAADIVPGISGGTVAFISGIYQRLLAAIKSVNIQLLVTLKKSGFAAAWQQLDGNFLLTLGCGILISVFSLAHAVSYLLVHHAILTWSFFFGLIFASSIHMLRQMQTCNFYNCLAVLAGVILAYWLTVQLPFHLASTPTNLFFAGAIAICAMILPGISGSFILLLMGIYPAVIDAIKTVDLPTIAIFATGCIVGLLCFSRIIFWMLQNYKNITIAFLTGLMIGSLNKMWPWKQNLAATEQCNETMATEINLLPWNYETITQSDSQFIAALAIFAIVVTVVLIFEYKYGKTKT